MDNIDLFINLIVIVLLIPAIVYVYKLDKNLTLMRQNQKALLKLIEALNDATYKAENSIPKLKSVTESSSNDLKEVVDNAKELKDDLMFINERADNLADRLEDAIKTGRQMKEGSPISEKKVTPIMAPQEKENTDDISRSEAEMELLKALRAIK